LVFHLFGRIFYAFSSEFFDRLSNTFFALLSRKISAVFFGGDLTVSVILVYFFQNVNYFLLMMST
jgi:hypothetical protein